MVNRRSRSRNNNAHNIANNNLRLHNLMPSSPQPSPGSSSASATASAADPRAVRAAALAAAEARLRPPPPAYDESEGQGQGQGQGQGVGDVLMAMPAAAADVDGSTAALSSQENFRDTTSGLGSSGSPQSSSSAIQVPVPVQAPSSSNTTTSTSRPASNNPAAQAREAAAAARLAALNNAAAAGASGSGSGLGGTEWRPSEKEDRESRVKFGRLLDRGIVRDNGYRQSADAVETLLKIATNIIENNDPKFRTLKATNTMLKNKILAAKGGHDYLIALGFRTQTVDFSQQYVFSATLKKMHELRIGAEILRDHLAALQKRVSLANQSVVNGASVEAARRAAALAEIEADRDTVKARVERERIVREAKERKAREEAEAAAAREAENVVDQYDENQREMRETVVRPGRGAGGVGEGQGDGNGDEDEEDGELPSYAEDRESRGWGGPGRRLGA